jgi:hypothetical protein
MTTYHPWQLIETELTAASTAWANPYLDVDAWATFRHNDGTTIVRPAFWDGGATWRVRFAPTKPGTWQWETGSAPRDAGLSGQTGAIIVVSRPTDVPETTAFERHGFWRIDPGARTLRHTDGTPAVMVGDTPWALPWRATIDDVRTYAADRQAKGFNAALLMSIQPDRRAVGPDARGVQDGFAVGFDDLPDGHINRLVPAYFQEVDTLAAILVAHGIVPVWQPVFHGYGWKGLGTAGPMIPADEYARYCRYLVARHGAQPAMWLVAADGDGLAPGVDPGGWEIERWDAYAHPTGLHDAPIYPPSAWHDRPWLDFQWCQTGHSGEHAPYRVSEMWHQSPPKAVANGEPTYERIGRYSSGTGWWQGHEAWTNLCAGATMGVVYGAGSLWQWRINRDEVHEAWACAAGADWRDALDFEGSRYVGAMSRILGDIDLGGMAPDTTHTSRRAALFRPGCLIVDLFDGKWVRVSRHDEVPSTYRIFDAKTGVVTAVGTVVVENGHALPIDTGIGPRVVIFSDG